jgi:hypothetical protein
MPRTRQGGLRPGTPGRAYPNRQDLAAQPDLPARVATGQTYGKAQAQLQAQRQVPMAPPPTLIAPAGGPGGPPPPGATSPLVPPAGAPPVPAGGPPLPEPGSFGPVDRYTERHGEPVTSGIPLGAGPGPEALLAGPISPAANNLSSMLNQMAAASGSQAVLALAQHAAANGQ